MFLKTVNFVLSAALIGFALLVPSAAALESAPETSLPEASSPEPRLCWIIIDEHNVIDVYASWCPVPTGPICYYIEGVLFNCVDPTG